MGHRTADVFFSNVTASMSGTQSDVDARQETCPIDTTTLRQGSVDVHKEDINVREVK